MHDCAHSYLSDGNSVSEVESGRVATFGQEMCVQLLHMLAILGNASPMLGLSLLQQENVGQVSVLACYIFLLDFASTNFLPADLEE